MIAGNGSIPGYNSCFIANYKTNETVMMFSNNIDYLDLKEDSDYICIIMLAIAQSLDFSIEKRSSN